MSRVVNVKHKDATLTDFQEQVCLGTLLGDSSLSCPRGGRNYHLSCYHSEKQTDWLQIKWQWLQPHTRPIQYCEYLDKRDGKTRAGGRFHTISAPCFSELSAVFYNNGRKAITDEMVSRINHPVALACLICDDGSWDGAGIAIASKQFTESDNRILASGLALTYQINVIPHWGGKYWSVRIPAASVARVRDLCLPFVPDSLKYKFGGEHYATHLVGKIEIKCSVCGRAFRDYESNGRSYCSRECVMKGRSTGYETRTKQVACQRCGVDFFPYNKKVALCSACRGKRVVSIPCIICGNPVEKEGNATCSKPCSVALGHKNR